MIKPLLRKLSRYFINAQARRRGVSVGAGGYIAPGSRFHVAASATVELADGVTVFPGFSLLAEEGATIKIGHNVFFADGAHLSAKPGARIIVGENCWFNKRVEIDARSEIRIGADGLFGPDCYLIDSNHRMVRGQSVKAQAMDACPMLLGDGVWLGVGATLLLGASLGEGAVVAARAVVNKPVPDWEIWGGIPARRIGMRPENQQSQT